MAHTRYGCGATSPHLAYSLDAWHDLQVHFQDGNTLSAWPRGGYVWYSSAGDVTPIYPAQLRGKASPQQAIAGFLELGQDGSGDAARILVFGDSSFLDESVTRNGPLSRGEGVGRGRGAGGDSDAVNSLASSVLLRTFMDFLTHGLIPAGDSWPEIVDLELDGYLDERLQTGAGAGTEEAGGGRGRQLMRCVHTTSHWPLAID